MTAYANLYCNRGDVTERLAPGAIISRGGLTVSSVAFSNALTFDGHGLEAGDPVTVRAIEGGALAEPLEPETTYFARRVSNATFELAATLGGPAIYLTSDGIEMLFTCEPNFDKWIEFYSRWADTFMPAHAAPMADPPPLVRGLVADLVSKRLLNIGGQDSAIITAFEESAQKQLERYAAGLPVPGATTHTNLAVRRTGSLGDPRGWSSRGGGIP